MKKLFYFFLLFSLFTVSCNKDEYVEIVDPIFQGPNDNQLIAGGWKLTDLIVKEIEIDNQEAADLILEQYRKQIGEVIGFYEGGTYATSGTFFEIASRYKLKDNVLIFGKDYSVNITFNDDKFSFESDYADGFQWFIKEASFMSDYKNTVVAKVVIEKVYTRLAQ